MPPAPPPSCPNVSESFSRIITTAELPARERLGYWLDVVCSLYCRLECEPSDEADIFGRIEFSRIADVDFTFVRSNTRRIWTPATRLDADSQDHFILLMPQEGAVVLRQGGREAVLRPGDFAVHDCARPYELVFPEAAHALHALRLPRSRLEGHIRALDDLTAITVSAQGAEGRLLQSMVDTLSIGLDKLHPASALAVSEGLTSVVAAGLRSLPDANRGQPSSLAAYHLARIRAHLREHVRDPGLSLASIAAAVGLSEAHVGRLFRHEPVPLFRVIQDQRLAGCRRDLADPRWVHRSVSDIAFSWGFNDAAHFSRCFRKQHGLPPTEWRQRELESLRTRETAETLQRPASHPAR
jgi:AraC-like DNA-binding protein